MPQTLFEPAGRANVEARLGKLGPEATRAWGSMGPAQMLAHCSAALEVATGDRPRKHQLIGKIFGPFVRKSLLGDKPFSRNSPTDPTFIVTDEREFDAEKRRLSTLVDRFCAAGPAKAGAQIHSFLGRMTGDEWGVMMYKHLDHHLRQFGL
ncbi:MAG: DUF1569 domain-containing protein [Acidobacteriota bacterium]